MRKTVDIIFLDIDGVIWTVPNEYRKRPEIKAAQRKYFRKRGMTKYQKRRWKLACRANRNTLDPIACVALNHLLEICPDARICVSSTWRKGRTIARLEEILLENNVTNAKGRVIGKTPGSKSGFRGGEVREWLNAPEVKKKLRVRKYVILDDDSDFYKYQLDKWVHTDGFSGMTMQDAGLAAFILGERDDCFHLLRMLDWTYKRMKRVRRSRPRLFAKIDSMLATRARKHRERQKRAIRRIRRQSGKG